jgi:hypothetical protein
MLITAENLLQPHRGLRRDKATGQLYYGHLWLKDNI